MESKAINQKRWIAKQKEQGRYLRQTYATDAEWRQMRNLLRQIRRHQSKG